jgi:PhnB protein
MPKKVKAKKVKAKKVKAKKVKAKKVKAKKVQPIPAGYRSLAPSLSLNDAGRLIEFCKEAFGGKVRGGVMTGPDGKILHAEIQLGDSILMLSDAIREPERPSNLFLYVPNVDKTIANAIKAGAKELDPIQNMFWGDRFGRIEDPLGNRWSIATHIEDVTPKEMKKRMAAMPPPG